MKQKTISNKTLAFLAVAGIILSLLGLLKALPSQSNTITGMIPFNTTNTSGTTSFKVEENVIVNITDATINLGDVEIGFNETSEGVSDWFNIANDGSLNIDVYAYGTGSPFTSTANGANALPNNFYFVHANSSQSGTINATYVSVPANASTKKLLITSLDNPSGFDDAAIGIKVSVPVDEDAGSKSATLVLLVEKTP